MTERKFVRVELSGDMACFTDPIHKIERVSFDVPPPTTVEGILRAIYWKPEFRYRVSQIEVLNPIRYEVFAERINKTFLSSKNRSPKTMIRTSRVLKDVCYAVCAEITSETRPELVPYYSTTFYDRLDAGAFFQQPVLGCNPFWATAKRVSRPRKTISLSKSFRLPTKITTGKDGFVVTRELEMKDGVLYVPEEVAA